MLDHAEILIQIESIKDFFHSIGLEKIKDIPQENWDLDSSYKFIPAKDRFTITYLGKERVLLSVNVFIVGGVHFNLSGKIGVSVFETIPTDYDFKVKYEDGGILKNEFRDWKINNLLNYENT
jgi:hypothetical protein